MQSESKDIDSGIVNVLVFAVAIVESMIHLGLLILVCISFAMVVIRCVNFYKQVKRRRKHKQTPYYSVQHSVFSV